MKVRAEPKVWGQRVIIHEDSTHTTNFLEVRKGFRCSWHRHHSKFNLFHVIAGKLELLIERTGTIVLGPGMSYQIHPGVRHEFRGLEDSLVIEEMYVRYDDEDIERENQGGRIPK